MRGVVVSGSNNHFLVDSGQGPYVRCGIKGKKLRALEGWYNALAPGDEVDIEPDAHDPERGLVVDLVSRRNVFRRFNEKGRADQAIACNLDLLVCVTSPVLPPFRPRFVDRATLVAERDGIPVLVLLNKADLDPDDEVRARLTDYARIGFRTLECSAASGAGIDALRDIIRGGTAAFVGQSGVGKSSVLNALEEGLDRRVGEVCEKYERGRHTTTSAVLVTLADGVTRVVDTPGFRRLAVRGIPPDELALLFPEMRPLVRECAFGSRCRHLDEEGCRVIEAVASGTVHEDRYESYARIRAELEDTVAYARKAGNPRRSRTYGLYDGYDHE